MLPAGSRTGSPVRDPVVFLEWNFPGPGGRPYLASGVQMVYRSRGAERIRFFWLVLQMVVFQLVGVSSQPRCSDLFIQLYRGRVPHEHHPVHPPAPADPGLVPAEGEEAGPKTLLPVLSEHKYLQDTGWEGQGMWNT
jgi:hypothetical protein